jgi:hypothetical protein
MSSLTSPPPCSIPQSRPRRFRPARISLLLLFFTCFGLMACGSSSKPRSSAASGTTAATRTATAATTPVSTTPTRPTTKATKEASKPTFGPGHALLVAMAACMRSHGIPMPNPDANNKVNLQGINIKSHHYQTVGLACYNAAQQAASKPTVPRR